MMNVFSISLGFNIENHISIIILNTIKIRYNGEIIRLNNIGKKKALFELEEGSL
jgi:hypothetical protein